MDLEKEILRTAQTAITEAVVKNLTEYGGPLRKLCESVMAKHESSLAALISDQVSATISADAFKDELRSALNAKLARTLIERMGGEIEKRVNELKSDPTTRAKITLAIQQAVAG